MVRQRYFFDQCNSLTNLNEHLLFVSSAAICVGGGYMYMGLSWRNHCSVGISHFYTGFKGLVVSSSSSAQLSALIRSVETPSVTGVKDPSAMSRAVQVSHLVYCRLIAGFWSLGNANDFGYTCGVEGRTCAGFTGNLPSRLGCQYNLAAYALPAWAPAESSGPVDGETAASTASSCWARIARLVPAAHPLEDTDSGSASTQGSNYFAERFCPGGGFLHADSCGDDEPDCVGSANAIIVSWVFPA